mgnify:CR=1 FL=1|jgi:DNA-binding response OmpR family regulator|tara:strand:+ start:43 stop:330 length:288 start_codon:yes stop_codon:yes gene_type:complete
MEGLSTQVLLPQNCGGWTNEKYPIGTYAMNSDNEILAPSCSVQQRHWITQHTSVIDMFIDAHVNRIRERLIEANKEKEIVRTTSGAKLADVHYIK